MRSVTEICSEVADMVLKSDLPGAAADDRPFRKSPVIRFGFIYASALEILGIFLTGCG
jgi:hypothetical protein